MHKILSTFSAVRRRTFTKREIDIRSGSAPTDSRPSQAGIDNNENVSNETIAEIKNNTIKKKGSR